MAFIDKLKEELDRAGKAAQGAFDEGKSRLEAFRTRQLADKAAQALGYAVFRAKQGGSDVDTDTYDRLSATLATHDAEAARYEAEIEMKRKDASADRTSTEDAARSADPAHASSSTPPPSAATAAGPDIGTPPGAQDISG
ncbi:MAG: hypothetical protein H0U13_08040 [Gemmatimonadaceae bacterium]|nr:hypothetical protein [Gemmatimonadaceae bacterium]